MISTEFRNEERKDMELRRGQLFYPSALNQHINKKDVKFLSPHTFRRDAMQEWAMKHHGLRPQSNKDQH